MLIAAVLVTFALTPLEPFSQSLASNGDATKIEAVREHIAAFEMSARQAKGKTEGDSQKLSALEKQYAEAATAFDAWRTAAVSAKSSAPDSTRRVEDLAKQAARTMAGFGRDARSFVSGRPSTVDSRVVGRFEDRLIEASKALSRADEPTREKASTSLMCRSWGEIR